MSSNYQTVPISDAENPQIDTATLTAAATTTISNLASSFKLSERISSATPAVRSFLTRVLNAVVVIFARTKPWSELFNISSFSKPASLSDATTRIRKNFSYFGVNYVALLVLLLTFSLISNLMSLFISLVLLAAWCVLYLFRPSDKPIILFGQTLPNGFILGVLIVLSIVVFYITPLGSTLISALMIMFLVTCIHGAFRDPSDLFLEENDPPVSGLVAAVLEGSSTSAADGSVVPII